MSTCSRHEGAMVAASGGEGPLLEERVFQNGAHADSAVGVQQLVRHADGACRLLQVERRKARRVVLHGELCQPQNALHAVLNVGWSCMAGCSVSVHAMQPNSTQFGKPGESFVLQLLSPGTE